MLRKHQQALTFVRTCKWLNLGEVPMARVQYIVDKPQGSTGGDHIRNRAFWSVEGTSVAEPDRFPG
jgi:hypothetical protein